MIMNELYTPMLIAGALAGALRSFLGYLDSDGPFNLKLFMATTIRTVMIGATIGFGSSLDPVSTFFFVYASDTIMNKGYKIGGKKEGT